MIEADGSVRGLDVFGGFLRDGHLHLMGEIRTPFRREWVFPLGTTTLEGRDLPGARGHRRSSSTATYGPTGGCRTRRTSSRRRGRPTAGSTAGSAAPGCGATSWDRSYSAAAGTPRRDRAVRLRALGRASEGRVPGTVVDVGCGRGATPCGWPGRASTRAGPRLRRRAASDAGGRARRRRAACPSSSGASTSASCARCWPGRPARARARSAGGDGPARRRRHGHARPGQPVAAGRDGAARAAAGSTSRSSTAPRRRTTRSPGSSNLRPLTSTPVGGRAAGPRRDGRRRASDRRAAHGATAGAPDLRMVVAWQR